MTTYLVHDNGARPFKVTVKGSDVKVYRKVPDDSPTNYESKSAMQFKAMKVFVGSDKGKARGNTILLQTGQKTFVFIGDSIFSFQATNAKKYFSRVGNSDVPYPYLETDEYYYLMGLGSRSYYKVPISAVPKGEDPYHVQWGMVEPAQRTSPKRTSSKKSKAKSKNRSRRRSQRRVSRRGKTVGTPFKVKMLHKRHIR